MRDVGKTDWRARRKFDIEKEKELSYYVLNLLKNNKK